jgi:hypothetical protein
VENQEREDFFTLKMLGKSMVKQKILKPDVKKLDID